jgi:hypothetical protein
MKCPGQLFRQARAEMSETLSLIPKEVRHLQAMQHRKAATALG